MTKNAIARSAIAPRAAARGEKGDDSYDPSAIEPPIYERWEKSGAFRAARPERKDAEPYCIVLPPPNVTGALHMGHALNATLQDILIRFERMRGKDVLWQPGTDHAGIATQMVVEKQIAREGNQSRQEMGREKFLKRVWDWKDQSGGEILDQLKTLGVSCDWSRDRFTMDEGLSEAVRECFVKLYEDDLIYRDKRLVNWDVKLRTAISDLEVVQKEIHGKLWHFKYPLQDGSGHITVATTRPETMLGDVAVAVHPQDERYKKLVGKMVKLPIVGRIIPIIADDYVDPEQGSGAVKITPAHDFNDFNIGKRHNLSMLRVLDIDGTVMPPIWETDLGEDYPFHDASHWKEAEKNLEQAYVPPRYWNKPREEARKQVVAEMKEKRFLVKVEDHRHSVPFGDRSGEIIEPRLTTQWYVNTKELAKTAIKAVEDGKMEFIPKRWGKVYFEWMRNIEPWCISRQLWWGHRIPIWYGSFKGVFAARSEEEAKKKAKKFYGCPIEVVELPLSLDLPIGIVGEPSKMPMELDSRIKKGIVKATISQDKDVLDTWFSSALWPFSTLGWPQNTPELKRFHPNNILITGFDIIFFWVARMMMMSLYFTKKIPFHKVYIHALVRDEKGQKMTKSRGNVVNPLKLIKTYGADALRFTLAAQESQGRDIKLSEARVAGYRNFGTKLWNAARFCRINQCEAPPDFDPKTPLKLTQSRWLRAKLARLAQETTDALDTCHFARAAQTLYDFTWHVFCDWHLELIKPILQKGSGEERAEIQAMTGYALQSLLRLLHPFMPFITEALARAPSDDKMLILADWPNPPSSPSDKEAEEEMEWVLNLIGSLRTARAALRVPPSARLKIFADLSDQSKTRFTRHREAIGRLARLSDENLAKAPKNAVRILLKNETIALDLEGVLDVAAERRRIEKEKARADKEHLDLEAKLKKKGFLKSAPEEVIARAKTRRDEARQKSERLRLLLSQL